MGSSTTERETRLMGRKRGRRGREVSTSGTDRQETTTARGLRETHDIREDLEKEELSDEGTHTCPILQSRPVPYPVRFSLKVKLILIPS